MTPLKETIGTMEERFEKLNYTDYTDGYAKIDEVKLKSFLHSEIERAVAEERERIADMVSNIPGTIFSSGNGKVVSPQSYISSCILSLNKQKL